MGIRPHYCCEKCGFSLNQPFEKCIGCGYQKVDINMNNLKTYGKMKQNIKIKVQLEKNGKPITQEKSFDNMDDLINWLIKNNNTLQV